MSLNPNARPRPALLYLSISDGLDARTNKEMATLAREFDVDYVGVSTGDTPPFFTNRIRRVVMIKGRSRSPVTLAKLGWRLLCLRWRNRYHSIHVVNEDLYLLFLPWLLGTPVVLDVFDSAFLKWNVAPWLVRFGQRLSYALPRKILVTDEERAMLMPAYTQSRLAIVPNYPFRYDGPTHQRDPQVVRILHAGSLMERRGSGFLRELLAVAEDVRIVMAGWIRDEATRELSRHPRVEWLGTIPQHESIEQATRCDFILCHYPPINQNNIYASPNKIYDAIQAGAGIIINPEARISEFVRRHGLGVVLDAYQPADLKAVARQLREFKAAYRPDPRLREEYVWEKVEPLLLAAHGAPGKN